MDSLFKQKLLTLRSPGKPATFSEALLGDTSWGKKPQPKSPEKRPLPEYSEKKQIIESLERFAQEKSEELKSPVIPVVGGEILMRAEPGWENVRSVSSLEEMKSGLKLESEPLAVILQEKNPGAVQVMFVTERFRPWNESSPELKQGFINELIVGLPLKTAELFERMITAMKLTPEEVIIFPVEGDEESDFSMDVMTVAAFFKPGVIVTLGAKATQKILKSNDRLAQVHGQFFARRIGDTYTAQVVPLFHPSIIETNQNMKKTAWTDMQKIMKHLKKLP